MIPFNPLNTRNEDPEVFRDHHELLQRIKKTLYYGRMPKKPCPSMAMTDIAVELFTKAGLQDTLDQLNVDQASKVSQPGYISPSSFVLALLYLDRLRTCNPEYLDKTTPAKLFIVSMMVAHKYLTEEDEDSFTCNKYWAEAADLELEEMNELEMEFLEALDWNLHTDEKAFESKLQWMERYTAWKEAFRRGWFTYSDLHVLSSFVNWSACWDLLFENVAKVSVVCMASHIATLMTLMGFTALVAQVPSLTRFNQDAASVQLSSDDSAANTTFVNDSSHPGFVPAQLLTTSLILASLGCPQEGEESLDSVALGTLGQHMGLYRNGYQWSRADTGLVIGTRLPHCKAVPGRDGCHRFTSVYREEDWNGKTSLSEDWDKGFNEDEWKYNGKGLKIGWSPHRTWDAFSDV